MMYNTIRWPIPDFLTDDNSNVCSISHHLRNIRKVKKLQTLTFEDQGRVVEITCFASFD